AGERGPRPEELVGGAGVIWARLEVAGGQALRRAGEDLDLLDGGAGEQVRDQRRHRRGQPEQEDEHLAGRPRRGGEEGDGDRRGGDEEGAEKQLAAEA